MSPEGNGLGGWVDPGCGPKVGVDSYPLESITYEENRRRETWRLECSRVIAVEGFRARL
jgi:hypothetical protein